MSIPPPDSAMPARDAERERLLRGEVQRRVRDLLSQVRSVFRRTVETGTSLDEVAQHFEGRLDVIARHQPIPGAHHDLERVVRAEFADFRFGYGEGVTIAGPDCALAPDEVLPVALAIHELMTNALKFGALAVPGATLSLSWSADTDGLVLCWEERGVPVLAAAPPRRGFGREFIEEALPFQIDAETAFALRPGGVVCTIRLPPREEDGGDG